jgi:hypothetical protein
MEETLKDIFEKLQKTCLISDEHGTYHEITRVRWSEDLNKVVLYYDAQ